MARSSRDRISVDLQGLKAALVSHAEATGLSPSDVVRRVLAEALSAPPTRCRGDAPARGPGRAGCDDVRRVSLRLDRAHGLALHEAARRSGLSAGTYVAGLLDGVAVLGGAGDRTASLAALTASNAALSSLGRDIRHLTHLLGRSEVQAARAYRARLDTVADEVRAHLRMASRALADLRPRRAARTADPSVRD